MKRRIDIIRRFVLPPGPIFVLTLIGMMLLSAVLYNRAVRAQRFLEPTLAIFQPRFSFYSFIDRLLVKEFGGPVVEGLRFENNSIYLKRSLIFVDVHRPEVSPAVQRLGRVFSALLRDAGMRAYVDFIVVSPRVPIGPDREANAVRRIQMQALAEVVLSGIFRATPDLEQDFAIYFQSSATSVYAAGDEAEWIEFRIVPSERLHIDVLRRLEKYVPAGQVSPSH